MSKFPNWIAGIGLGTVGVLGLAYYGAEWSVGPAPKYVAPEPVQVAEAKPAAPAGVADEKPDTPAKSDTILVSAAHADETPEPGPLGIGRPALQEEIDAWNLDVHPDGSGLPEGSGSVEDGEALFSENCAICHGEFAEGVDNWPELAGGDGTLADDDPVKTVGSYWPYLSTAWDYVHRSMPYGNAQTLSDDDVYAIVAYILYSNYLVEDDFVLSKENFLDVEMPNADGFVIDDRPQTEYPQWTGDPCMENCKETVEITMRASNLDVTPGVETEAEAEAQAGKDEATETVAAVEAPKAEDPAAAEPAVEEKPAAEGPDPQLVAAGEKVFKKCQACHEVGEGAKNKSGPELNGIVGRGIGSVEGFRYSKVFEAAHDEGRIWDAAALAEFLANPKSIMKGTKMSFAGLKKEAELDAIIAFLSSHGE